MIGIKAHACFGMYVKSNQKRIAATDKTWNVMNNNQVTRIASTYIEVYYIIWCNNVKYDDVTR